MPVVFSCPSCGKRLSVPDDLAGKSVRCPQCQTVCEAPAAIAVPPPPPPLFSVPAAQAAAIVAQRSGAVTAVAIVNFILGGLACLCGILTALTGPAFIAFVKTAIEEAQKQGEAIPQVEQLDWVLGLGAGIFLLTGACVLLSGIPMIIAGFGVAKRRQWGRILTLVSGGLTGLLALVSLVSLVTGNCAACGGFAINAGYAVFVFVVLLNKTYAAEFS